MGSAVNLSHAALNCRMQFSRSLPRPCAPTSRMGTTVSMAQVQLMLDSEGGPENGKLWKWYQEQGFVPAKEDGKPSGVMYGPHWKFIPELASQRAAVSSK